MPSTRPDDAYIGRPVNQLERNALEAKPDLTLPAHLSKEVRRLAKNFIKLNPHIEQTQINILVRYCQMTVRWNQLEAIVENEGPMIEGEYGKIQNPALRVQLDLSAKMDTLERSLLIQTRARRELLSKKERKQEKPAPKQPASVRPLRIA